MTWKQITVEIAEAEEAFIIVVVVVIIIFGFLDAGC
jgi:hypothetical protein